MQKVFWSTADFFCNNNIQHLTTRDEQLVIKITDRTFK